MSENSNDMLIRKATELLDKYDELLDKFDTTKQEAIDQIKKELLEYNVDEVAANLKKELEKVAGSVDVVKIAKELDNKFQVLSQKLEDKAKEFDGSAVLEKFKTDSKKLLDAISDGVEMVKFQHTIPSRIGSDRIQKFKIIGEKDCSYAIKTNGLFSFNKVKNISSGEEIAMRTPMIKENDNVNFEIKITEDDGIKTRTKIVDVEILHKYSAGQIVYETPGNHTFIVPPGVTSICAVAVGAGGGGRRSWSGPGGNGGALAYANNIPVTPGQAITITVGRGGSQSSKGGNSNVGGFFYAEGGYHGNNSTDTTLFHKIHILLYFTWFRIIFITVIAF